jgi:hypothetical protein
LKGDVLTVLLSGVDGHQSTLADDAGIQFEDYFNSSEREVTWLIKGGMTTYAEGRPTSGLINKASVCWNTSIMK